MSELFSHNLDTDAAAQAEAKLGSHWYLRVYTLVITGMLVPLLLIASFNFVNDRYSVLRDDSIFMPESNLDIVRLRYLIENNDQRRLVLLGTSRANALDLQGQLSDSAYAFPIDGGRIYYYSLALRNLIANGVIPETLILGLGEAVTYSPELVGYQNIYLHPQLDELSFLDFTRRYLLFIPAERDFRIFSNRVRGYLGGIDQQRAREIIQTGRKYCIECEARVRARSDREHIAMLRENIRRWSIPHMQMDAAEKGVAYALKTIGEIQQLTETHGIRLFIYLDPQYREFYLDKFDPSLMLFRRELAGIQPFLDFGDFNDVYNNPKSFLDPLHYNKELGVVITDDIAAAMRGDTEQLSLGRWITPENVDNYTRQLEAEYKQIMEPE